MIERQAIAEIPERVSEFARKLGAYSPIRYRESTLLGLVEDKERRFAR